MIPSNGRILVLMLVKNPGSGVSTCRDHALRGRLRVRGRFRQARKHGSVSALSLLRQHRIEGEVGARWRRVAELADLNMTHRLPTPQCLTPDTPDDGVQPSITIVGAGHSMVAQDRVGPRVIELLRGHCADNVDLCDMGTSGLDLLDKFLAQDLMIIVDACIGMAAPGELVQTEPDLDAVPTPSASVHQIGPIEALLVAKHLYPERLPKRVLLMLVETGGVDDKTAEDACHRVVDAVQRQIRQIGLSAESGTSELPTTKSVATATNC